MLKPSDAGTATSLLDGFIFAFALGTTTVSAKFQDVSEWEAKMTVDRSDEDTITLDLNRTIEGTSVLQGRGQFLFASREEVRFLQALLSVVLERFPEVAAAADRDPVTGAWTARVAEDL